jgi:hypothetical protein
LLSPLGLIDRPFAPHNLIPAQESPIPLQKFQMFPDLKFEVLWFKERNPYILPFSLKTSRQENPLQVSQWAPYRDRYLLTGQFYISRDTQGYYKKKQTLSMLY